MVALSALPKGALGRMVGPSSHDGEVGPVTGLLRVSIVVSKRRIAVTAPQAPPVASVITTGSV